MTTLKGDLACSGAYSAELKGYDFTVDFILSGVAGSTAIEMVFNAINDTQVPGVGTDLSAVDATLTGCWLRKITGVMLSPGKVKLTLKYQHSPVNELHIEAASSLNHITTNKDKDGTAISLEYEYPADYKLNSAVAGETITQGGTFTKLVPERSLIYSIRENTSPQLFADGYEGKVNNAPWQGGAAGTWLCASITGRSDNSGADYLNRYIFQYRSDGWDPEVHFVDPNTGKPPPDLVADTGIKTVATYTAATFTDLFPAA